MALDQPPIQEKTANDMGVFPVVWVLWLQSIVEDSNSGYTGSFTNGDGDTVTVTNGKITDVS